MSYVDGLREGRGRAAAVFMEFSRMVKENPIILYCFFEGDDEQYYGIRISQIRGEIYKSFSCSGRDQVLAIREKIRKEVTYCGIRALFFIDRDYICKDIDDAYVYVTPTHSIENFYLDYYAVKKIVEVEFKIIPTTSEGFSCLSLFLELWNDFLSCIEDVTIFLSAHAKKELKDGVRNLNVSQFEIHKMIKVSLIGVEKKYSWDDLKAIFPGGHDITQDEYKKELEAIKKDIEKYVRGKFAISFLKKFLELLLAESRNNEYKIFIKNKNSGRKAFANVVSDFSQYAKTPACLSKFLTQPL